MPEYYTNNDVLMHKPGLTNRPVSHPSWLLAILVMCVVIGAVAYAASTFGQAGPITQGRARQGLALIEFKDKETTVYRTGWLCTPTTIITSRDAVVDPRGIQREGLVVHLSGGDEKCAVQNVEYDKSGGPGQAAAQQLRGNYGVIVLQPSQRRLRPLLANTDQNALQVGAPVRLLGYDREKRFWPPGPADVIRKVGRYQNEEVVVPYTEALSSDSLIGAPLVDLRDSRVIGMLVSNSAAPGSTNERSLQWALPVHVLKPVLQKAGAAGVK